MDDKDIPDLEPHASQQPADEDRYAGTPQPGGRFLMPTCTEETYRGTQRRVEFNHRNNTITRTEIESDRVALVPGSRTIVTNQRLRTFPDFEPLEGSAFTLSAVEVGTLMARLGEENNSFMRTVHTQTPIMHLITTACCLCVYAD
jgi:hypothetical protein